MEVVVREDKMKLRKIILGNQHQRIGFADNLILKVKSKKELKRTVINRKKEARKQNLEMNLEEELLKTTEEREKYQFEKLDEFICIAALIGA